jgi:hypothetical protein
LLQDIRGILADQGTPVFSASAIPDVSSSQNLMTRPPKKYQLEDAPNRWLHKANTPMNQSERDEVTLRVLSYSKFMNFKTFSEIATLFRAEPLCGLDYTSFDVFTGPPLRLKMTAGGRNC